VNRAAGWIERRGLDPVALRRRALGGVFIGLMVVLIDRVMGFGS